jgi:hypothetical protein
MTRLIRRFAASFALVVAVVAFTAPSSLAIPIVPGDGPSDQTPRPTTRTKKQRLNAPLARCREQRHVRIVGCPVPW